MASGSSTDGAFSWSFAPRDTLVTAVADRNALSDSAKWKLIYDNALQLSSAGFLTAGFVGMLVARATPVRVGFATFGAGWGLGRAYVDMRYLFNHDVKVNREYVAKVVPRAAAAAEDAPVAKPDA